jgi:hypothetical protein
MLVHTVQAGQEAVPKSPDLALLPSRITSDDVDPRDSKKPSNLTNVLILLFNLAHYSPEF